jgi:LysM repeat protein
MNKTYEVRRGDTLTLIARRHQTTVEALVQANGIPNPDLIRVGQVLVIPAAPGRPSEAPGPRAPEPALAELGGLSRKYEAFGPGTVSTGQGDAGGVSYGSYQFATKTGSAQAFVDSLKDSHPHYHAALAGKTPGTEPFSRAWKELAEKDPRGFDRAQHENIRRTHYEPAVIGIRQATGLDLVDGGPARAPADG